MAKTHEGDWSGVVGAAVAVPAALGAAIAETVVTGSIREGARTGWMVASDTARSAGEFGDRHQGVIREITGAAAEVGRAALTALTAGHRPNL